MIADDATRATNDPKMQGAGGIALTSKFHCSRGVRIGG